ncbi:MAG TPA: DUF2188 domain-containing protein [Ignavibacteria bacterium]|nr:hypothetical protein [Bacteroidota bacterium]HRE11140.1 DUF2188 domain-containing protein [Ignavibacteria bacterium]HRF65879.1 DUF2188 domain-containing protein [Ignavibacteria bacterium]HRJ04501.1 DUF2188 domain-containing protein [Ignavibacteria bacterium]
MSKKNQHIVPLGNGWAVKGEGNSKYTAITDTKEKAMVVGKAIAKSNKSELVIHAKNGKIIDRDSYGNDPYPPKDKKH